MIRPRLRIGRLRICGFGRRFSRLHLRRGRHSLWSTPIISTPSLIPSTPHPTPLRQLTNINISQTILHPDRKVTRRQRPPVHRRPIVIPRIGLNPPILLQAKVGIINVVALSGYEVVRRGKSRRQWRSCCYVGYRPEVVELVVDEVLVGGGLVAVAGRGCRGRRGGGGGCGDEGGERREEREAGEH